MLQPDADLLETNVQLNLLNFLQKLIAKLHVAGSSADQPDGLFGQGYHLSRKQYAQHFERATNPIAPSTRHDQEFSTVPASSPDSSD